MAVKLRLMRMGKKKQPTYRLVAADGRSPRDGRFIEIVGIYDPRAEPSAIRIDNDKAVAWLQKAPQPPEGVQQRLKIPGAGEQFKPGWGGPAPTAGATSSPTRRSTETASKARSPGPSSNTWPRPSSTTPTR